MLSLISQHTSTLLKVYLVSFYSTSHLATMKKMECILKGKEKKDSHQNETWQKY